MLVSPKEGYEDIWPSQHLKGTSFMGISIRNGLRLVVSTHAANHHEVTLVQSSFDFYVIEANPEYKMGDKAHDSDKLDAELKAEGVKTISPHRHGSNKRKTQDRRKLRRYDRR